MTKWSLPICGRDYFGENLILTNVLVHFPPLFCEQPGTLSGGGLGSKHNSAHLWGGTSLFRS